MVLWTVSFGGEGLGEGDHLMHEFMTRLSLVSLFCFVMQATQGIPQIGGKRLSQNLQH